MRRIVLALVVLVMFSFSLNLAAQETAVAIHSEEWIAVQTHLRQAQMSPGQKVRAVHTFLNATPHKQFLVDGGYVVAPDKTANCHDFSTTKQIMLKNLGFESRIYVVRVRSNGRLHAYVLVHVGDGVLVLDDARLNPLSAKEAAELYEPLVPK